jgi:tetratricopeptide (TPR) repeat protein
MTAMLSAVETVKSARDLLLSGHVNDALGTLESVRKAAKNYPSFYIVLGECLLASHYEEDAKAAFKHALQLAPNSARAALLLESIVDPVLLKEVVVEKQALTQPRTLASLFEDAPRSKEIARPKKKIASPIKTPETKPTESFNLAHVASMLTKDRPLVRPASHADLETEVLPDAETAHETHLVSETLAGILLGQGKFEEALQAYKKLRKQEPGRKSYFDERIKTIEQRLKGSKQKHR